MPYFHITREDRIPSILRHGLGALGKRNFPESEPGVYLSTEPGIGLLFLVEHYMEHGEPDSSPAVELESYRVIVIDDARLSPAKIGPDPSFPDASHFRLYTGTIDVAGMPIFPASTIFDTWRP